MWRCVLFSNSAAAWFHSNQYNNESACEHCSGIVRHERWCITRNPMVQYAFRVVADPESLSIADRMILHALGISWSKNSCSTARKKAETV
jgi:hypothetical protein